MWSAKELVDNLLPSDRQRLEIYLVRPYLLKVLQELGVDMEVVARLKYPLGDTMQVVVMAVRSLLRTIEDQKKAINNQQKEIERRAQLTYRYMEQHESYKADN